MVGNKFDFDKLRAHGHMLIQIKPKKEMKKDSKAEQKKLMEAQRGLSPAKTSDKAPTVIELNQENGETIKAMRFDFTMNQCIYRLNMRVDEFGERLTTYTHHTARIVSGDCMIHEPSFE